jgi:threonine/homoserine/homoserine lactone efflux protein
VGLAYMLVLAWRLARSAGGLAQADGARLEVGFAQGVALQFVNIKAWMNALMISAGWVTVDGQVAQRLAIVLPLMMAYGLAEQPHLRPGGLGPAALARPGRRLLVFNRALAFVLAATAAWMAFL